MSVDPEVLKALSSALTDLREKPQAPIPPGVLDALAPLAASGKQLKIDLEASRLIGAPLVTVVEQVSTKDLLSPLTPRQREVAELVIAGQSNRAIAEVLGISVATVKDHVHAILERLGLPSRHAVIAATRATVKA
ncbi:LuxR C-terminal-related transcriptional regulator [Roseibium sp. SCP14]|uniref:LuxR C-terminal-related transcriptional regulator n=1 Tax=Roseibium sp. SCP14 TaxID=3141375 RepID=UPI0033381F27